MSGYRTLLHNILKTKILVIICAISVAAIGSALLMSSHAATTIGSIRAADGTVSGIATKINDPSASNGSAVQFGNGQRVCPPPPAYPNAACTGYIPGTSLTNVGDLVVTTPGQVVQNVKASSILVKAANVTIKNSLVQATGSTTADLIHNQSTGLVVEDTEIDGSSGGNSSICSTAGIGASDYTAIRLKIHNTGDDPFKAVGNNITIRDSYAYNPASCGAHWDGLQSQVGVSNVIFQHNTITADGTCPLCTGGGYVDSAILISPDQGPTGDGPLTITQNYLSGGGQYYTVRMTDGNCGQYLQKGIVFTDNVFDKTNIPYGAWRRSNDEIPYIQMSGNTYSDGSALGNPDVGC